MSKLPKLPPPNKTQPIPSTHNWIYAVLIVLVGGGSGEYTIMASQAEEIRKELATLHEQYPFGYSSVAQKKVNELTRILPYANTVDNTSPSL